MRSGLQLVVVVGAATPPGRLAAAARRFADEALRTQEELSVASVDLHKSSIDICDGRPMAECSASTKAAVQSIENADIVAIFSPTYRGSFPGVLKNLLDQLPLDALRSKPVGIVAMGATEHHYLGVDWHLRAVLAWFGALVAPTSPYLTGRDFGPDRLPSASALAELTALTDTLVRLAAAPGDTSLGPPPLAERQP